MAGPAETLRIFISSPSDVRPERLIAQRIIERLDREFGELLHAQAFLWEREPLVASRHFQDPDNIPPPSTMDIVAVIMWSRLGLALPDDKRGAISKRVVTGTEWEFEDAFAKAMATNPPRPDLLFYLKTAEPMTGLGNLAAAQEKITQFELVGDFINRWFHGPDHKVKAPLHRFVSTAEFEGLLYDHLQALLKKRITRTNKEKRWHPAPFRGLQSFEFEHAQIFFGRTRARNELREMLSRQAAKGTAFVLVLGASGSGKSSLIKAGLLPDLMLPGMIGRVALCRRAVMRPANSPDDLMRALSAAILSPTALPELADLRYTPERLADLFRKAPEQTILPIEQGLAQAGNAAQLTKIAESRLIVVIDQLEELFTIQSIDEQQRKDFVAVLTALAKSGLVWVLATMRSDFFTQLASFPELGALANPEARYLLSPPDSAEIGQMIRGPAAEAGLQFEHDEDNIGLDEKIQQAASSQGALPLLSFLLDQLWQKRTEDETLTFAAYKALGGLEGALSNHATQVFQAQPPDVQKALPRVLRALVTISSSTANEATARTIPKQLFDAKSPEGMLIKSFLDADARLLVAEGDDAVGGARIRVTHEALLTHWDRAREQIAIDRGELELKTRLELAATRWKNYRQEQRDSLLLSSGLPLSEASDLLQRRREECDPAVIDYIESSIAAENARARREREREEARLRREQEYSEERSRLEREHAEDVLRRQVVAARARARLYRIFSAVAGFLLVLAIGGGAYAWYQRIQSENSKVLALGIAGKNFQIIEDASHTNSIATDVAQGILAANRDAIEKLAHMQQTSGVVALQMQVLALQAQIYSNSGNRPGALQAANALNALAAQWAKSDPANQEWQNFLAISYDGIGDAANVAGDIDGASNAYASETGIAARLAKADPNDACLQYRWRSSLESLGDTLKSKGETAEALKTYQQAEAITEPTANQPAAAATVQCVPVPTSLVWQRQLATIKSRIGDAFLAEGDISSANSEYQAVFGIFQTLMQGSPDSDDLKWGLMVADERLGDAMRASNNLTGALAKYGDFQTIAAALLKKDPNNPTWQRQNALAIERRGSILLKQGSYKDALAAFKDFLTATDTYTKGDPNNSLYTVDVALGAEMLGDAQLKTNDIAGALISYQKFLDGMTAAVKASPSNAIWQRDLAVAHERIGSALLAQHNLRGAKTEFGLCASLPLKDPVVDEENPDPPQVTVFCNQQSTAIDVTSR